MCFKKILLSLLYFFIFTETVAANQSEPSLSFVSGAVVESSKSPSEPFRYEFGNGPDAFPHTFIQLHNKNLCIISIGEYTGIEYMKLGGSLKNWINCSIETAKSEGISITGICGSLIGSLGVDLSSLGVSGGVFSYALLISCLEQARRLHGTFETCLNETNGFEHACTDLSSTIESRLEENRESLSEDSEHLKSYSTIHSF